MVIHGTYSPARGKVVVELNKVVVGVGVIEKGRIRCWVDQTASP